MGETVVEYRDHKIRILQDDFQELFHPRTTEDNLGIMACWHRRYNLGDPSVRENFPTPEDFHEWLTPSKKRELIILPVYMYEHGGVCLNTEGYYCPWDSCQVGYIYVSRRQAREELGLSRITKKQEERIKGFLRAEVERYSQYLNGEVFYYIVEDPEGVEIDSCSGFIGGDFRENGLIEYAENAIDANFRGAAG